MSSSPARPSHTSGSDWLQLLLLSVLWGGSFLFIGVAVKSLPPLVIVTARVGLAAAVLWLTLRVTNVPAPRGLTVWRSLLGMAMLNNVVPFLLFAWAQSHIAAGVASILNATTPLFTVVVAHLVTEDEKLSGSRAMGVLAGLVGVAVMTGAAPSGTTLWEWLAELACLAAACSYAFSNLYGRRFKAMGVPPLAIATGQLTMSFVVLAPVTLLATEPWTLLSAPPLAWAAVIGLAIPSTALAYVIFFRVLRTAGPTNLSLVTFLIPVTAVLLGVTLLGEDLAPRQIAGMAMIALGLAAIDGRPWTMLVRRMAPVR
ncbi:DMT family transporter [Alsobacter sp. SYSU M60028]|uniref:DMT family transporter n=1 Tax=Alsobacter ponti TaxID=2962936 RepID=A0ABT1L9P3_9HYPH|nr:EamA family transporter [Alsobacter ponti]MCP8938205.1 DMT family transporter [Alsobacter ponti]